jgi:hypothetical protein
MNAIRPLALALVLNGCSGIMGDEALSASRDEVRAEQTRNTEAYVALLRCATEQWLRLDDGVSPVEAVARALAAACSNEVSVVAAIESEGRRGAERDQVWENFRSGQQLVSLVLAFRAKARQKPSP